MELYRKYPTLCTVWAAVEVLCFAGLVFGWGTLVFVLKDEGILSDLCEVNNTKVYNHTRISFRQDVDSNTTTASVYDVRPTGVDITPHCEAEDAMLNLYFTIATTLMYLTYIIGGQLHYKLGTRTTRTVYV
jgi:LAT3 family solute carrier family 43 protein 3